MIQPFFYPSLFELKNFLFQTLKRNSLYKGNLLEKEHIFYQNFRDKIRFWKKLSQRFRMRINNFKTFQVLNLKTSNEWKFEGKLYLWNQCLREVLLVKRHFLHNFSLYESQILRLRALLKTMEECEKNLDNKFEKKIQKLVWFRISFFYKGSNFETRNWKRVRLPANFVQLAKIWIDFFTAC